MEHIIEIRKLVKKFGAFTAVNDVSFSVSKGSVYGFLGHNGAGKSTIIKIMCGVYHPTKGSVNVAGIDVVKRPEDVRSNLGYMSQKFTLYEDLTVKENLTFYADIYGLKKNVRKERIDALKDMTKLLGKDDDIVKTLSGGWKQRLALSCALLHSPPLLILDEPTAGVDPVSRIIFWDIIKGLAEDGLTVFVTTHYMDEAELCDKIGIIYEGKLIAEGSPAALKKKANVSTLADVFIKYTAPGGVES